MDKRTCKHFNGAYHNKTCRAGVCYDDVTTEPQQLEGKAAMARMMKTMTVTAEVKREHKGKDWKGTKPCPVCGGALHMTHSAYNGHVWGKCETADCVSWME